MKHGVIFALALFFAAALQEAGAQDVFRSGHSGEPDSLDPHQASSGTAIIIVNELFEGLLTLSAHGKPVLGSAEHWEVDATGTRYRFRLRENLSWSDGTPLGAGDFVYAFRRLADPNTRGSLLAVYLHRIKGGRQALRGEIPPDQIGVRQLSPRELEIELEEPTPFFPTMLASPALVPVPRHAVDAHGDRWTQPGNLVSNGPFQLDSWVPQEVVRLKRNDRFHAAETVALARAEFYPLDDLNTGLRKFRAGELDAMVNFPPDRLDWIRENLPGALRLSPSLGLYVYVLNVREPPLDDVRVRRALSLATDREALTQRLIKTGDKPAWGLIPPGIANYLEPLPDPAAGVAAKDKQAQAVALLADAGYGPNNPLTVEIKYHTSEEHKRVAVALAAMWRRVGVIAQLSNAERAVVQAAAKNGDFQVLRAAWFSLYEDAYGLLNFFVSDSPSNYSGYVSDAFDQGLLEANRIADTADRAAALRKVELMLMQDQPVIPLFYYVSRRLVTPTLAGWEDDNLTAFHPARYLRFKE